MMIGCWICSSHHRESTPIISNYHCHHRLHIRDLQRPHPQSWLRRRRQKRKASANISLENHLMPCVGRANLTWTPKSWRECAPCLHRSSKSSFCHIAHELRPQSRQPSLQSLNLCFATLRLISSGRQWLSASTSIATRTAFVRSCRCLMGK